MNPIVSGKLPLFVLVYAMMVLNVTHAQSGTGAPNGSTEAFSYHRLVTLGAIRTYQLLISPSKGTSCPMHPHCSLYGHRAFQHHNPLQAFMMTADRLHRCGHDLENYATVEIEGFVRFLDPVSWSLPRDQAETVSQPGISQLISVPPSNTESDESPNAEDRLFRFAESMRTEGDYGRAITEYRRLLSYYPDSSHQQQALKAIVECYYGLGEYLTAAHWGQGILAKKVDGVEADELRYRIGLSYFRVGNYRLARERFTQVVDSAQADIQEKSSLLQGLAYGHENRWDEAATAFAQVPSNSMFANHAQACEKLSLAGKQLHQKNPALAGVLAIIPGLGYLYDGYKQTALSSLIVNSLFIAGTYEAFRQDNESLGAMMAVLSFGWYTGNIYGSVVSAQRKNLRLRDDLLAQFDIGFRF